MRERVALSEAELPDAVAESFIADQQAFVEAAARRRFKPGDLGYELAGVVVTDLAALLALARLSGGSGHGLDYRIGKLDVSKQGQREDRVRAAAELQARAAAGLEMLLRLLRPRRFVFVNGKN